MLTQSRLKELYNYDPKTGLFYRKVSIRGFAKGSKVGYTGKRGYCEIGVDGKHYQAHRLAWLYVYGEFPSKYIDHINGMPGDNRISNLRDVDQTQNIENQKKAHKNSKTGFLGVRLMRKSFTARIQCGSTTHHLGTFSTPEEAHEVYKEAKRKLHLGSTL